MYSKWQLGIKYLRYYIAASNGKGHGMHSPFIFDFITKVLTDKANYEAYPKVEQLRQQLLNDSRLFVIEDFGAGRKFLKENERSISSIARNAAKSKKFGQLLFRIAHFYAPKTIVELGTSLGITSSYLALAQPTSKLITMEGAKVIAEMAKQNFSKLSLNNIELVEGNFDQTLSGVLDKLDKVGLGFIDGNHRQEPTERYFLQILPKIHNDTILIFDDIHWSREMEQAWRTIKSHPSVRCSIDLFFIGIVFFREEFREKQHFTIRF